MGLLSKEVDRFLAREKFGDEEDLDLVCRKCKLVRCTQIGVEGTSRWKEHLNLQGEVVAVQKVQVSLPGCYDRAKPRTQGKRLWRHIL